MGEGVSFIVLHDPKLSPVFLRGAQRVNALTNDSSQTACCKVLATVELNLGLRKSLIE
jgi:hypothetical protein